MKLIKKLQKTYYALPAAAIANLMMMSDANATNEGLKGVTERLDQNLNQLPNLFSSAAYVIGIGFTIAGLFKLKEYVDAPDQANMKDALIRLGVGALMILLPFAVQTSAETIGADTDAALAAGNLEGFSGLGQ